MNNKVKALLITLLFLIFSFCFYKLNWYSLNKSYFDFLYSLSAPVVALLALFGLEQIRLTKKIADMNEKRRLFEMTIDRCQFYEKEICSEFNNLIIILNKKKINFFEKSKITYADGQIKDIKICDDQDELNKAWPFMPQIVNIFNKTNVYAASMISGIANEELAYWSDGRSFCYFFELFFPGFLCATYEKKEGTENYEVNTHGIDYTIELYKKWRKNLERDTIKKELSSIEKKRDEIQKRLKEFIND